jgi:hypothetical protein
VAELLGRPLVEVERAARRVKPYIQAKRLVAPTEQLTLG